MLCSKLERRPNSQVKRCDEMARRLRFFTEQVEKAGLTPTVHSASGKHELDDLESRLEELEKELISMNENTERLDRTYNELVELQVRPLARTRSAQLHPRPLCLLHSERY